MALYTKRSPSKESIKFLEDSGFTHVASIGHGYSSWNLGGVTWTFSIKNSPTNIEELIKDVYKTGIDSGKVHERHRIANDLNDKMRKLILPKEELNFDPDNHEY